MRGWIAPYHDLPPAPPTTRRRRRPPWYAPGSNFRWWSSPISAGTAPACGWSPTRRHSPRCSPQFPRNVGPGGASAKVPHEGEAGLFYVRPPGGSARTGDFGDAEIRHRMSSATAAGRCASWCSTDPRAGRVPPALSAASRRAGWRRCRRYGEHVRLVFRRQSLQGLDLPQRHGRSDARRSTVAFDASRPSDPGFPFRPDRRALRKAWRRCAEGEGFSHHRGQRRRFRGDACVGSRARR